MRGFAVLVMILVVAGCSQSKPPRSPLAGSTTLRTQPERTSSVNTNKPTVIVTPSTSVAGKVILVRPTARYVVISYPIGMMPPVEQRLNVYRKGLKVGELKVTGPQVDINIAADILSGDCEVGDEVKRD